MSSELEGNGSNQWKYTQCVNALKYLCSFPKTVSERVHTNVKSFLKSAAHGVEGDAENTLV